MTAPVAFLFLGETLLIPHLYPVLASLAASHPELDIDVWVATATHEALIGGWIGDARNVALRRAPGFVARPAAAAGANPPLPAKLPLLARLAPRLARSRVVVCAEQTSLWLPALLPLRTRFIDTFHGAGSMRAKGHWRRRAAWRTLVSSEREKAALVALGDTPARVGVTGYVKASFAHRTPARRLFADDRPIVLYNPHWQRHRSSWWAWGEEVVRRIADDPRVNLIFAPHQRLVERAPEVRAVAARYAGRADVLCDLDGFRAVDGSYTVAADLYLGDTSSQLVEFVAQPRPCVLLDHEARADWRQDPSYAQWGCGEVVTSLDRLLPAIREAPAAHARYAAFQRAFAAESLGDTSGAAPANAVAYILEALAPRSGPA